MMLHDFLRSNRDQLIRRDLIERSLPPNH